MTPSAESETIRRQISRLASHSDLQALQIDLQALQIKTLQHALLMTIGATILLTIVVMRLAQRP